MEPRDSPNASTSTLGAPSSELSGSFSSANVHRLRTSAGIREEHGFIPIKLSTQDKVFVKKSRPNQPGSVWAQVMRPNPIVIHKPVERSIAEFDLAVWNKLGKREFSNCYGNSSTGYCQHKYANASQANKKVQIDGCLGLWKERLSTLIGFKAVPSPY